MWRFIDCCTGEERGQGGFERSLGEELASPKTPSRILPVLSTAIFEKDHAGIELGAGQLSSVCRQDYSSWLKSHSRFQIQISFTISQAVTS